MLSCKSGDLTEGRVQKKKSPKGRRVCHRGSQGIAKRRKAISFCMLRGVGKNLWGGGKIIVFKNYR